MIGLLLFSTIFIVKYATLFVEGAETTTEYLEPITDKWFMTWHKMHMLRMEIWHEETLPNASPKRIAWLQKAVDEARCELEEMDMPFHKRMKSWLQRKLTGKYTTKMYFNHEETLAEMNRTGELDEGPPPDFIPTYSPQEVDEILNPDVSLEDFTPAHLKDLYKEDDEEVEQERWRLWNIRLKQEKAREQRRKARALKKQLQRPRLFKVFDKLMNFTKSRRR